MVAQHRVVLFTTADAHHFGSTAWELAAAANIIKLRPLKAPAMLDFMIFAEWEDILYLYESREGWFDARLASEWRNSPVSE